MKMNAAQSSLVATSHKKGVTVKTIKINRTRRVTKDIVTAARAAVRKANEDARKARLHRIRNKQ